MSALAKAKPAIGRQVAYRGGLWSCWSQAPGVGEWWLMPVDDRAKRSFARTKYGKSQGCLLVKSKDMDPPCHNTSSRYPRTSGNRRSCCETTA